MNFPKQSASIVICTCNRAQSLELTLAAIGRLQVPADLEIELLVVDNASTDATPTMVQAFHLPNMPLRYIAEPRRGKGNAYNSGIANAKGEILIFTDDDVRPEPRWLAAHLKCYLDSGVAAVQGRVTMAFDEPPPAWYDPKEHGEFGGANKGDAPIMPYSDFLVGANMSFRRQVAQELGGFNPLLGPGRSGFYDDTDFSERLRRAGHVQRYEPEASVKHIISGNRLTPEYFKDAYFRLGVSVFIATNYDEKRSFARHALDFTFAAWRKCKAEVKFLLRRNRPALAQSDMFFELDCGQIWARLQGKKRLLRRYSS